MDATIDAAERYGERVLVLTYEQLVLDPERTMRARGRRGSGSTGRRQLLQPTFNGRPIARELERADGRRARGSSPERADRVLRRPTHRRPAGTGTSGLRSWSATATSASPARRCPRDEDPLRARAPRRRAARAGAAAAPRPRPRDPPRGAARQVRATRTTSSRRSRTNASGSRTTQLPSTGGRARSSPREVCASGSTTSATSSRATGTTPKLRARAANGAPAAARARPASSRALAAARSVAERSLPPPEQYVERYCAEEQPDVVLVTPLDRPRLAPGRLAARGEAARHPHRLPGLQLGQPDEQGPRPRRARPVARLERPAGARGGGAARDPARPDPVTGAPVGDPWFEWQPSRSREELCAEVGLRPDAADRPLPVLLRVRRAERGRVRPALDRAPARARRAARRRRLPDPAVPGHRAALGRRRDSTGRRCASGRASASRRTTTRSRWNYFDSIHHAAAVVGINTTAQIESAIVGRPVHTILAEEFRETQEGTLHFRYLEADGLRAPARRAHLRRARRRSSRRRFAARATTGGTSGSCDASSGRSGSTGRPRRSSPMRSRSSAHRPAPAPESGPAYAPLVRPLLAASRSAADGEKREQGCASGALPGSCGERSTGSRAGSAADRSPGPGPATRSASSSTGSRSCAGRRPRTSGCASGCTSRARPGARGLVRGDRRGHRSARRREAPRPGARAGRSLRAGPPGPRPAHPAPSARVRAAARGRPVRRPVRRRGLPRRARRAAGQGDRRERAPIRTTC